MTIVEEGCQHVSVVERNHAIRPLLCRFMPLPQHQDDISKRDQTRAHHDGLARERAQRIHRCVDSAEASVVWVALVALPGNKDSPMTLNS